MQNFPSSKLFKATYNSFWKWIFNFSSVAVWSSVNWILLGKTQQKEAALGKIDNIQQKQPFQTKEVTPTLPS